MLRIMKLIIIIMTAFFMQVSATAIAQRVTIQNNNITLKNAFSEIRKQTGYILLAESQLINKAKPIKLDLRNVDLQRALKTLLEGQNLEFSIKDKSIVVKEKTEKNVFEKITEFFQFGNVTGRVYDDKGVPVPGATVRVKGSSNGVMTGQGGDFIIQNVNVGDVLIVSFIGYQPSEMKLTEEMVNSNNKIIFRLSILNANLEEVSIVNTGYQTLKREKVTGAIVTLDSKDIEKRNAINLFDNLEGTVPGLIRSRERGNTTTTIRGTSTVSANRSILVVVDGFPIEGSVDNLNPYDIESINVLKDAAAAAIYGARAANGVIVVTTKSAKEKNKTNVEFSANVNYFQKPDYSLMNMLSPSQQVDFESGYFDWYFKGAGGQLPNAVTTFETALNRGTLYTPIQYAYYQYTKNPATYSLAQLSQQLEAYRQNDFIKEFSENALENRVVQQYNFAIRTNSGRTQNSLVVNYSADNTGIINTYNRQINLFYKGSFNVAKWLDIDYGVNGILGYAKNHNNASATDPTLVSSYQNMFNADGSRSYYAPLWANYSPFFNTNVIEKDANLRSLRVNNLDELERDFVNTNTFNTRYYVGMNLKVLPGLTVNPRFQYEDNKRDVSGYSEAESYTMRLLTNQYTTRTGTAPNYVYQNLVPLGGRISTNTVRSPSYTARGQADYNRDFGKHGISAIAGMEFRQTLSSGRTGIQYGYNDQLQTVNNLIDYRTINTSPGIRPYWSTLTSPGILPGSINQEVRHRFASAYANLTYTYDRKYNVFGSLRKDYADIFGSDPEYRGRPLWSVGGSWMASNEDFMENYKFIDFLKLRASYGLTGNVDLNATSLLVATAGVNSDTQETNANISTPPNAQLRWEQTASVDLGLDFALLKNRIRGTVDYYRKSSKDILSTKKLDPSEGWSSLNINNASIVNKGVEVSLAYDWFKPSRTDRLGITTNFVFTHNRGIVTQADQIGSNLTVAQAGGYVQGYSPNSLFSIRSAGLNAQGVQQWASANGTVSSSALLTTDFNNFVYSGVTTPTRTIGFNNDFAYRGFTLSVYMIYNGGHVFRKQFYRDGFLAQPSNFPAPGYIANSWTPTNTNTNVPGAGQYYVFNTVASQTSPVSDELIRPADFVKIRTLVFGYDLSQNIAKKIGARSVRLRFQVNNLPSIWMKQKDLDIDIESGSNYTTGFYNVPVPVSYVFGLTTNF
jgi:TonB-linked SusC/RagA family outer membrane protein